MARPRWLLVTSAWPWPARRGLQARTQELVRLAEERAELTILAPRATSGATPPAGVRVETFRVPVAGAPAGVGSALVRGRALQTGLFASADLRRIFGELAPAHDVVVLQTARFAGLVDRRARFGGMPDDRLVVDLIDSLSLNFATRATLDRPWLRPFWRFESRRLARDERALVAASRAALVVADRDRRHLGPSLGEELARRVKVVPLVVEAPAEAPARRARDTGSFSLLVTGNLGYFPTRHGLAWFLAEIWPRVRREIPSARLVVAGSRPPGALAAAIRAAGAELVVDPPSFAPSFAAADVALAPLFGGSGTPMKLLEAIAAGVPVLATPFAADGLEPALARRVETVEPAVWPEALAAAARDPEAARARATATRSLALGLHAPDSIRVRFEAGLSG